LLTKTDKDLTEHARSMSADRDPAAGEPVVPVIPAVPAETAADQLEALRAALRKADG
jgi:hypothetical protein